MHRVGLILPDDFQLLNLAPERDHALASGVALPGSISESENGGGSDFHG
jgi:hypothetical protein